ncbi:hypothetical protein [Brevundimonas vesicularis]|uniref:Uncharacterized protein n=1 Tax=Brevundimonas vesicularis TaxID=41276 RepID=A0A1Z3U6K6_BREVE|nr:hypothetical protein [Brevundimonas vesicularis]ASE38584.1 hypothetical protein CEP68_03185 [Brevundimonas vesicularis]MDX2333413.1 hypothetical protein [Brevundimonas vesicularis]
MMLILSALMAAAIQTAPAAGWTWSLYEGEGPMVLANDIPDTASLRATLQCLPGSGAVSVAVYGEDASAGFARITSGGATATSEARLGRGGKLETAIPVEHPAFSAFVSNGRMTIAVGDDASTITVERPHMAKLRRFADRCAG